VPADVRFHVDVRELIFACASPGFSSVAAILLLWPGRGWFGSVR
jgi:hypothetical protein